MSTLDYQHGYLKLKELFEEQNVPVWSFFRERQPYSKELKDAFLDMVEIHAATCKKDKLTSEFELYHKLKNDVKLDEGRIQVYYHWDVGVQKKKNLALETYPELLQQEDDDGLLEICPDVDLNKNGFKYKNHYLIFPEYFTNNFHFTEWLIRNWNGKFKLKVSFEYDKLGMPDTRRDTLLMAHWRGPKHLRHVQKSLNRSEFIEKRTVFNGQYCLNDKTEFLFVKDSADTWTFQIEELIPMDGVLGYDEVTSLKGKKILFYTRYLHAIVNKDLSQCYHLDGALREYGSYDAWCSRNELSLRDSSIRSLTDRYKLFRIDSSSGIIDFHEIIGLFFKSNPYVLEFFEGESEDYAQSENRRRVFMERYLKEKKFKSVQSLS